MSSIAISLIVFAFVFGGALLGMFLQSVLPQHHLNDKSKDVVKLGMALVASMSALVLSLLVSSAKNSYDAQSNELRAVSSNIILLDHTLAHYGPETKDVRELLRTTIAGTLERRELKKSANPARLGVPIHEMDSLYDKIQELSPKDDRQRSVQSQALGILVSLQQTRWLMYEQESSAISMPFLVILVSWLVILFISFGLYAPVNGTTVASLVLSALVATGAIFLTIELYTPYKGLIEISSVPLKDALAVLGK
jgi:hypothetical protein